MTTSFIYKPDSNTWFWMISAVFMGIGLCYIIVLSLNSSNAIWKLVLALSPFVFLFWTCARVVQYRFEYARTEADKIVELDHEIPKLTIKKNGEKYQILRTDIKQVNIFESYGDSPPFTDFTYLEIVLKSGKRFTIANRTATRQDLSVMLKGKKKVLKKRFMNRIKTTANKLPPEKTA